MLSKLRAAAVLFALALAAAACGSATDDTATGDTATTTPPADGAAEPAAPTSILDISAPGADGSTIDLSTYAGQDLMLWFWAPW